MSKQGYEVNGEVFLNLKEVATALGLEKVTKKDVTEGEYKDLVTLVEVEDAEAEAGESVDNSPKDDTLVSTEEVQATSTDAVNNEPPSMVDEASTVEGHEDKAEEIESQKLYVSQYIKISHTSQKLKKF